MKIRSEKEKARNRVRALEWYYENKASVLAKRKREYQENSVVKKRRSLEYYEKNKEAIAIKSADYRKARYAEIVAQKKAHYEANKRQILADIAAYKRANPGKVNALKAKRRARLLRATPAWADLDSIKNVYLEAAYFGLHVDHIVPLQGKTVCGLHVWDNLQLLTRSENSKKHNKLQEHLT